MTPSTNPDLDRPVPKIRQLINKAIDGSHNHYSCFLPKKLGIVSSRILKLFYSGIKVDLDQTEKIKHIEKDAIIVYATKFKSYFEYLFYFTRYQQSQLPFPIFGFEYKVWLWQPLSRILRIFLAQLDFFLQHRSLPDPYKSGYIKQQLMEGQSGFLSITGKKGFYRRFVKAKTDPIQYLIEMQQSIDRPIFIIPQLLFFSKDPHRANPGMIDILFGPEEKPGNIRRVLTLFKNPGKVFVEISNPINLKQYLAAAELKEQSVDYQALVLRRNLLVQLNRHHQSITGPMLKSRIELKESILTNERFLDFLNQYSENRDIPLQEVRKKASGYLDEIAADYKPAFIKIASAIVKWINNNMFDGFTANYDVLNKIKSMSIKGPLIFIPCHKSHIDYLILSYLLYHNNMPCPHIAAGKNLSFWPLGPIFRSGGAFFLRRSFKGALLYSRVFAEYIHKLLEEGFNIEQFIEGGRSRTGKLLMPKLGLLSILLNAYKNGACEDMIIAPIFIGYDRILEEKAYLHELDGGQKEPENLLQIIRARRFLKKRYGKIYIQFSEPMSMTELLAGHDTPVTEMTSKEINTLCRLISTRVMNAINTITVVTPHALVASALLNMSKERFSFNDLMSIIGIYMHCLNSQNAKLSDTLVMDQVRAIEQVLDSYVQRKFIEPQSKDKENQVSEKIYLVNTAKRPFLEYYKNNCIAFFIPSAFTALDILTLDAFQFSATDLHGGYKFLQDFFKLEFIGDVDKPPEFFIRKTIKAFIDDAILMPHQTLPDTYNVTAAGFRKLKLFSLFLKTYFESYWVVLNFFMRNSKDSIQSKDRLKKIEARGDRMYKRKEIQCKEALSKANYKNAVEFFQNTGIKGSDDSEKIDFYAAAIEKFLKHLQD